MTTAVVRGLARAQLEALQLAMQAGHCTQLNGAHRVQRRAQGAFYTPAPLVDFVTRLVLQPWLDDSARAAVKPAALTVLDPAAGDGRFLRCADQLLRGAGHVAPTLIGIERDAITAASTREAFASATIHCNEALLDAPTLPLVDVVLGNPPYVRSILLRQRDPVLWQGLRKRFAATSVGEWDLYGAFLEKALQWVRPGGRIGMVVPSRWLTAQFASGLRAHVGAHVETIVDFGSQQLFADATTYIAVVVMQRTSTVQAVAVAHHQAKTWHIETVPRRALANVAAPWSLRSTPPMTTGDLTLGDVADVVKGVGTNADSVFIVEPIATDGALTQVRTAHGRELWLESAALQPVWRGRDVGLVAPVRHCIFPYRDGALIDAVVLAAQWPRLAAYFDLHRDALQAREGGRFTGPSFYCFGRPQNFSFLLSPLAKVVMPDVTVGGRAVLDCGSLVLDSAYALRPRTSAPVEFQSMPWWRVLLSSPMVRIWLQATGVPLRGGYLRMKTTYLRTLPLPAVSAALDTSIAAASAGDTAASLEALRMAYGVSRDAWKT